MKKKKEHLYLTIVLLTAFLAASIIGNVYQHYHFRNVTKMAVTDTVTNTVYVEKTDTAPKVLTETVTGYVKTSDIFLQNSPHPSKEEEVLTENQSEAVKGSQSFDRKTTDSVKSFYDDGQKLSKLDSLPVVQKTYSDSIYTAYVSGIKFNDFPRLDSIAMREKIIYQTVKTKHQLKHWHVGVTAGYGFTPQNGMQPYVGIGITYSILSF